MSTNEAFFVGRTLQALEVLAFEPRTAPQVAAALQVHPRTARRLLNRLTIDGWLRRTDGPRPRYAPTMRIVALAAQLSDRSPVVRFGAEVAETLHRESGLAVHLAVPSYRNALRLVAADARDTRTCRDLAPAHAIAGGKLLLAYRDPWRESVLERPLEVVTPATVIDPAGVRAEAEATRQRGYAVEEGEFRLGMCAVAVPVHDAFGEAIAALAVSWPAGELSDFADTRDILRSHAGVLTKRLEDVAA